MGTLWEILFDFVVDFFMSLTEDKPGRRPWVRIVGLVLGLCTMLAGLIYGAYDGWQNGIEIQMYLCLAGLVLLVAVPLIVIVLRIMRNRHKDQ